MQKLFYLILILFFSISIGGCGSSGEYTEKDSLKPLTIEANKIIEQGGIAAVGGAHSERRDLARQKVMINTSYEIIKNAKKRLRQLADDYKSEMDLPQKPIITDQPSFPSEILTPGSSKDIKIIKQDIRKQEDYYKSFVIAFFPLDKLNERLIKYIKEKTGIYEKFISSETYKEWH